MTDIDWEVAQQAGRLEQGARKLPTTDLTLANIKLALMMLDLTAAHDARRN